MYTYTIYIRNNFVRYNPRPIWKEDILDSVQDFDGAEYKDAIEDAVDELTNNPKQLEKAILAGIKATKQEEVYQKLERQSGT